MRMTKQLIQNREYIFPYHYLDLYLDEYRLIRSMTYLSYISLVKEMLKPFRGQLVLDAGCGDGRFCFELRNKNVVIEGVDYSKEALAFAKAFSPDTTFHIADLTSFKPAKKYQYVVCIETLEHIIPQNIPLVLKSLHDCLVEGGSLIMTVPSKNVALLDKHYEHFDEGGLRTTLRPYFEIVKIVGHGRVGLRRRIFTLLSQVGLVLLSFRNRVPLVKIYYVLLRRYFLRHVEAAEASNAERLIVVCNKAGHV